MKSNNLFTTIQRASRPQIQSRLSPRQHTHSASSHTQGLPPLRLMPLGGSVTQGVGSSCSTGYRKPFLSLLQGHGFNAQMVGSRSSSASLPHHNHEGWRGFRIDEIERKARKSVESLRPNVFAVNAGSNDCLQAFDIENAGARIAALLEYLWRASPGSTVLLSTLLVSADREVDVRVVRVNSQFRALVERERAAGRRVVLVDMYGVDGPQVDCLVDGIHPDDAGYDRMARLWFGGVQQALREGFLNSPQDGV
ncbi:hypothetical protein FE257_001312 [Aspergillus nanangensis]|uniref:SGNH hydrolase-type esterase domain-containing protein n=1 Tax=Aspergillus nanangensis TaxID=2582783 RepID=A0AAD4CE22_ASPNN|nr:hypothetical protein FE257_001312 [Aspergillus nanangensis]